MKRQKTCLVTGASRGIGKAICERLLENDRQVIGIARHHDATLMSHPGFTAITLDLQPDENLSQTLQTLAKEHRNIDSLILCAGRGQFGSLEEFSHEQIRSLMDMNFLGQAWLVRSFLPQMKRRKQGDIIFMGSEAALNGGRRGAIYCASKYALRGLAGALRDECARSGIRVTLINPGMVKTGFFDDLPFTHGDEEANYILPEDVAGAVELVLNTRNDTILDEISLSPRNRSLRFKKDA